MGVAEDSGWRQPDPYSQGLVLSRGRKTPADAESWLCDFAACHELLIRGSWSFTEEQMR